MNAPYEATGKLSAGGDINIVAQIVETIRSTTDGAMETVTTEIRNIGSDIIAGGNLSILAGDGSITLQASHLGGDGVTLAAAEFLNFLVGIDQTRTVTTGHSSNGLTDTYYDHGSDIQSLVYTTIDTGDGGLTVSASQINIDYLAGTISGTVDAKGNWSQTGVVTQSPTDAIARSINQPGMGWMSQLANDPSQNVNWNGVTITNTTWDNDQTVMNPAAAAFIAIIASVVTAGAASGVFAAAGGAVASAVGATTTTAITAATVTASVSGALTAFTSSLISGVICGAITGNLDMGQVLTNALVSGLTAGLTAGINNMFFPGSIDKVLAPFSPQSGGLGLTLADINAINVIDTVGKIVVDAGVSAGLRAVLLGEDFGDSFLNSLKYNAVNMLIEPIGFAAAGDMGVPGGSLGNALLHAVIGGAGGYIVGGVEGLQGGALGALLGELILGGDQNADLGTAQIIGGLASLVVGDASMAGADAALNGVVYNYLTHRQTQKLAADLIQCNGNVECLRSKIDEAINTSKAQNEIGYCPAGICSNVLFNKDFDFNILTGSEINAVLISLKNVLPPDTLTNAQIAQLTSLQVTGYNHLTYGTTDPSGVNLWAGYGDYERQINIARCGGNFECERSIDLAWAAEVIGIAALAATPMPAIPSSRLSTSDILFPNGKPVGTQSGGVGPNIYTVTTSEFSQIESQLMQGATPATTPAGYQGNWFQRTDGTVFGLRLSETNGMTIDIIKSNNPLIPPGFKVHQN